MNRAFYRVWQFAQYAGARLSPASRETVAAQLGPKLAELFNQMSPAEQAHALRVAEALTTRGRTEPDLIAAALLHDVGKTRAPLALWERTLVVLTSKIAPRLAERLGRAGDGSSALRRPFITAQQHPTWGAELAERAGAPPRVVALIGRHQFSPTGQAPQTDEDRMLAALKEADEES